MHSINKTGNQLTKHLVVLHTYTKAAKT